MASSHLLRVLLRPTRIYRRISLSRTLPLYTGVFHHRFFSDTPIRSSELSSASEDDSLPVKPRKRHRAPKKRKNLLTEEDEAAMSVSKLNLPPIDKWRQYFAIMEGQRLRFFLRNPDTAQMLAESFVPEGSKDLIVIEAAAGMHSYLFYFS